jgi:magnesium chelatase subunit D
VTARPATPALAAAALFAVDPLALGGVRVRSAAGPRRDAWLAALRALLPQTTPWRRLPAHVDDDRLLGGLDLGATLAEGRPVAQRGVLEQADGGIVVVAMAERVGAGLAARLAGVLDRGEVQAQRGGLTLASPARVCLLALDEGIDDDEGLPATLADRLALHVDLDGSPTSDASTVSALDIVAARARLSSVVCDDVTLQALVGAAAALGVASSRAAWYALHAARCAAALAGRDAVTPDDARLALRWVLAPRATQMPRLGDEDEAPAPAPPPPQDRADSEQAHDDSADPAAGDAPLEDRLIEAARAAIPAGLLALLQAGPRRDRRNASAGRVGAVAASKSRGRPVGARRGEPRGGARLNLIETLRAAAPWQRLRRGVAAASAQRVMVRREDLHVTRYQQRRATTTLFVIDASGSAALHRLAEAKGAVELLLADCYARRDQVAVLAFRGAGAQLLLPPTRSLVRARRSLAGLPGGGGTPLAAGLDAVRSLADAVRRGGATPLLVVLTDGRANIARDGQPGRERAQADALHAARSLAALACPTLLVDTSPQPAAAAQQLAGAMGARYLALPHAAAAALSNAVRAERG